MSLLDNALPGLPSNARFTFYERPQLLAPDDRLSYRKAMLVCSIAHCRRQKSTYARLSVLNFAVRSPRLRWSLQRLVAGIGNASDVIVRFDPFFPRVLDFGVAEKLVSQTDDGAAFTLAERGAAIVKVIADNNLFQIERAFFDAIAPELSERTVLDLASGHRS